jgi:hypothetical protein
MASGYSSTSIGRGGGSDPSSELHVDKSRAAATVTLSNGAAVKGCFFVSGSSRTHAGPESVKDVLNGETGFFPFEVAGSSSATLYNRDHVVMVALADNNEPRQDPGYHLATVRMVMMLLSTGARVRGVVRVYRPHGHNRLSDFTRSVETFRYLEAEGATYLINVSHILELTEETAAP